MPETDGIALLRTCREIDRELACIVMTGQGTIATAVDALKAGALDYVLKPFKINSLLPVLAERWRRAVCSSRISNCASPCRSTNSRGHHSGLEHGEVVSERWRPQASTAT